ncbi:phage major tail protein, TP901-1 family [Enterococcus sp. AZ126]|uniref:phage major tail protein, TP901-1 family n=1 Tax=Enterococcus sp. AZ126 TaxID=2774635 RepID=UPI003F21ED66
MTALSGVDVVWRFRLAEDEGNESAWGLAYSTENGYSKSKESESTVTKDGSVVTPGATETTVTATTLYKIGSTQIDKLETAMDENKRVQIWRINTKEIGTGNDQGKFKAKYFEGYFTSFEETDSAENKVEYSLEWAIEGAGKNGFAVLELDTSEGGDYEFKDTVKVEAKA